MCEYIVGFNIKGSNLVNDITKFIEEFKLWDSDGELKTVVFAPYPYIALLSAELRYNHTCVGAQNVSCTEYIKDASGVRKGAAAPTGDVSAVDLKDLSCSCTLIGSGDRRFYLDESSDTIAVKAAECLEAGVRPFLCVGEFYNQASACGNDISSQLKPVIKVLCCMKKSAKDICIVYEPWADMKNLAPSADQIDMKIKQIKDIFNSNNLDTPLVLYGGDIGDNTMQDILSLKNSNGLLLDWQL